MKMRLEDMTEPELAEFMTALARSIGGTAAHLGVERPLFVLVVFNDPALGQYISNCERADVIKAMRETASRLERKEDVTR
jgi:hypothetical protein